MLRPLIFEDRTGSAFASRVCEIAERLEVDPDWIMACIAFESAGTFSPSVRNPRSTAIGLIQFMAFTAKRLGTTTDRLAAMTALEQLDYVERYFLPYAGRLHELSDVYMAILWPRAVGKAPGYVLFAREDGAAYRWNAGLDVNRDGAVTKAEAASKIEKLYRRADEERDALIDAREPFSRSRMFPAVTFWVDDEEVD